MLNAESNPSSINVHYYNYHTTLPCLSDYFVGGAKNPGQILWTPVILSLTNDLE